MNVKIRRHGFSIKLSFIKLLHYLQDVTSDEEQNDTLVDSEEVTLLSS